MFNRYIKKKKRRILDIGCSGGYFLKYFKERGWDAIGIEPSLFAARYAKAQGIEVINKLFQDISLKDLGKFDAINMSFVLEHVLDPIEVCKKCYRLLKRGGMLCVEAPNDFNPLQQIVKSELKKPSWWIAHPDHINYFTPGSLEKMMKRIGFKLLLKEGTFPMELFLLMGEDYIGNDRVGLRCHKKR